MSGANPCISVVVPIKDRPEFLNQCLASVARQTFKDWECLLVDDGSGPETLALEADWIDRDSRFRSVARRNDLTGANACRNAGWKAARSPLVVFLDSDDMLAENALHNRLRESNGSKQVLVFNGEAFSKQPGDLRILWNLPSFESPIDRNLNLDMPWPISGPTWPRQVLVALGGFDEHLPSWQEWDLHMRALISGVIFIHRSKCDMFVRTASTNSTSMKIFREQYHIRQAVMLMTRIEGMLEEYSALNGVRANRIELIRRHLIVKMGELFGSRAAFREVGLFPEWRRRSVRRRLIISVLASVTPSLLRDRLSSLIWGQAFKLDSDRRIFMRMSVPDLLASSDLSPLKE